MPFGRYAPNSKEFEGAQIVYVRDYNTDGSLVGLGGGDGDGDASVSRVFAGAIAPPLILEVANEEYPFRLAKARRIEFFCRTDDEVRYAYQEGGTYLPSIGYRTLRPGSEKDLNFGNGYFDGIIYFASSTAGAVVEIEVWSADTVDLQTDGGSTEFSP
jgi:hypothetical protein